MAGLTRWFFVSFGVLVFATGAAARDVVIPPVIDPPAASLEALRWTPSIDRSAAREVGRLRFEPAVGRDENDLSRDGVVQTLSAPLPLSAATARIEIEGAAASRMRFTGVPE